MAGVPAEDKRSAVDTVLGGVNPMVRNMVNLLVARGLVDAIPEACEEYAELLDRQEGRQRVAVTTAVPLTDDELRRITDFISGLIGREVVVTAHVDEGNPRGAGNPDR